MTWTRRDTLAILFLALLPFAWFWPLLAPGDARQWFPDGDFVDQFYAFASYETARFAAGELPLWNPFAYAGGPFWADVQAAVAYPPSLAVTLFSAWRWGELPLLALELEAVAHIGLAACLTYLFARHLLRNRPAALVAALVFGFGGYLTGYPMLQLAVLESNAWLPLALLGVARLAEGMGEPKRPPRIDPWIALALGMAILAGHPQSALYLIYGVGAYALWRFRDLPRRLWLRVMASLAASMALGLGLAAAGWWPALEFLGLSNRAEAYYAMLSNGFPPTELLGLVLPGITHWAPLYLGVLPLLLAVAALLAWGRRGADIARSGASQGGRDIPFWAGLGLLALLLSLGRHGFGFDLFYQFAPGFDLFRGQERAAFLAAFALAMLAGAGMALWEREGADGAAADEGDLDPASIGRDLVRGALLLAAFGLTLGFLATPELRPPALRLALLAGGVAFLVALRSGLLGAWGGSGLRARLWLLAGIALILVDLQPALGGINLVPRAPAELRPGPALAMARETMPQRVINEDRLPPNVGMLYGLESIGGASPLRLKRFDALREGLGGGPGEGQDSEAESRLWDLFAVSHLLTWREQLPVPSSILIEQAGAKSIERAGAKGAESASGGDSTDGEPAALGGDFAAGPIYLHLPEWTNGRAWRAMRAERIEDDALALERLRDPGFDPLSSVILADGEAGGGADFKASSSPIGHGPGFSRARTDGSEPGWLVFSEMHYPGWRATVDGEPAPLLRADLALIAVPVPAGAHEVEIRFEAPRVLQGIAISLATGLLLLVLASHGAWRHAAREASAATMHSDILSAARSSARPYHQAPLRSSVLAICMLAPLLTACIGRTPARSELPDPRGPMDDVGVDGPADRNANPDGPIDAPGLSPRPEPGLGDQSEASSGQTWTVPGLRLAFPWLGQAQPAPAGASVDGLSQAAGAGDPGRNGDIAAAPPPALPPPGPARPDCPGIAVRQGDALAIDGQAFRFFGLNAPFLMERDFPESRIEPLLAELSALGVNTLRIWYFHQQDPERFARLLDAGDRQGIRYVVTLADDVHKGVDWFFGPEDEEDFRPHLARTVSRFRDRPEILLWEPVNEPNCGDGRHNDACLDIIRGWLTMMAEQIRAIDACRVVSTSVIGVGNFDNDRAHYKKLHGKDAIDILSIHKRSTDRVDEALEIGRDLGKPMVFGEIYDEAFDAGCQPLSGDRSASSRAERVKDDLREALDAGVDGYLLWELTAGLVQKTGGGSKDYCSSFGFPTEDPLWDKLGRAGLPPAVPWR